MDWGLRGRRDPLAWAAFYAGAICTLRDVVRWIDGMPDADSRLLSIAYVSLVPPLLIAAVEGVRRWERGRIGRLGLGAVVATWVGLGFLVLACLVVAAGGRGKTALVILFVGVDLATLGLLCLAGFLLARGVHRRTPYVLIMVGTLGFALSVDGTAMAILPLGWAVLLGLAAAAFGPGWLLLGHYTLKARAPLPTTHRPSSLRSRIAIVAAAMLLVVSMAAVEGVGTRSAASLLYPVRDTVPATPARENLTYQDVTFDTQDGLTLKGWWIPSTRTMNECIIIFLHGYGDNRTQGLEVAPFLHEAGYHLLLFDFRGHGQSEGTFTTVGLDEVKDVEAAVAFAQRQPMTTPHCTALFGYSMGASTALNAANGIPDVQAIISDSGFSDLQNIVANSFRHFTCDTGLCLPRYPFGPLAVLAGAWIIDRDLQSNVPAHAVQGIQKPVFLIQGANDTIILPRSDGERLRDAVGPYGEYWLVPDAKHVTARKVAGDEYERRVLDFLNRMFSAG